VRLHIGVANFVVILVADNGHFLVFFPSFHGKYSGFLVAAWFSSIYTVYILSHIYR
jgi:hypothetical protein